MTAAQKSEATAPKRSRSFEASTDDFAFDESKVIDMMAGGGRPMVDMEHIIANGVLGLLNFEVDIVEVDGNISHTSLAYEKFMAEGVIIEIHDSKDPQAPPLVGAGVNGDMRWFPRNKLIKIPRVFVEVLAQSNERSYTTKETKNVEQDNRMDVTPKNTPSYPFSVVRDPSGEKGRRWLAMMVRQGLAGHRPN